MGGAGSPILWIHCLPADMAVQWGLPEGLRMKLDDVSLVSTAFVKKQVRDNDEVTLTSLRSLAEDPDLKRVFDAIRDKSDMGTEAAATYVEDERLMCKVSEKMGGVPQKLKDEIARFSNEPQTFHDAAKMNDTNAVAKFLEWRDYPVDTENERGITPLGIAIANDAQDVVKVLLQWNASIGSVDRWGNSALNYAAGYGRVALVELLFESGADKSQTNLQGQTAFDVAKKNKHESVLSFF